MPDRAQAAYRGVVYGYRLLDPATGQIRIDYVGQTRQRGKARELQHREDKPWSDLIVGDPVVLWEQVCTDAELDAAEVEFIHSVAPRMNYRDNLSNPERIEIWRQKDLRWARDDAAGLPRWVPLEQRRRDSLLEWPDRPQDRIVPVRRTGIAHRLTPFGIKAGLWSVTWVLLGAVVLGGFHHFEVRASWQVQLVTAGLSAVVLLLWGIRRQPDSWRLWRRRLRKARRRWFR